MEKRVRFGCPLDCFGACGLIATVVDDRVVSVKGDPDHPVTQGKICPKGKKHLTRLYDSQRLTHPLKRINGQFLPVAWDEILDEIAAKLAAIKNTYGTPAILHHTYDGYGGILKSIDQIFFNCFGGVTVYRGSLCWGAGTAAQRYDFGDIRGHIPADILNAQTIIVWGRNPLATNIHLASYLRQAQKAGAKIILIDPIKSASARLCDVFIPIRPATDGALALAMANVIISEGLVDQTFVKNRTLGFDLFKSSVEDFTPRKAAAITGLKEDQIIWLARMYANTKPASIVVGYGLQRYRNGGNNVRCIDALGALTGNIGIKGGGINYANFSIARFVDSRFFKPRVPFRDHRTYSIAKLGEFIQQANDPPVQMVFVTKSNPLVQCPDLHRTLQAFQQVEYKVVIDMFMTDTARHADVVLPCTSILEEEDILFSSMYSPYLNYSSQAVAAPQGVMSEYDVFQQLAHRLELPDYPYLSRSAYLQAALSPLLESFDLTLHDLKNSYFKIPGEDIPWASGAFDTPSGKYEFFSERAQAEGNSPLPRYVAAAQGAPSYGLRLITPHIADSMHSQHMGSAQGIAAAHINSRTLQEQGLEPDTQAVIETVKGRMDVIVRRDDDVGDDIVMIYQGRWHNNGAVNFLTSDDISDMGEQAAYYDCFCRVIPG